MLLGCDGGANNRACISAALHVADRRARDQHQVVRPLMPETLFRKPSHAVVVFAPDLVEVQAKKGASLK
jgi:hypothetical protein